MLVGGSSSAGAAHAAASTSSGKATFLLVAVTTRFASLTASARCWDVASGRTAEGVALDVTDGAAVEALAASVEDELGPVAVLCNNAGVFAGGLVWESTDDDWEWVMGVNVQGIANGIRAFGLDAGVAVPAVFLFRIGTFWFPILPGYLAYKRLQAEGAL